MLQEELGVLPEPPEGPDIFPRKPRLADPATCAFS